MADVRPEKPYENAAMPITVRVAADVDRHTGQASNRGYCRTGAGNVADSSAKRLSGALRAAACRAAVPRDSPTMLQVHIADISATVVSSIRLENPHSLSYQLDTLTRRPETLVSVASKIDERASWLKSLDTSGSVL